MRGFRSAWTTSQRISDGRRQLLDRCRTPPPKLYCPCDQIMPTYEYECTSCHHTFEVLQRITEDPLTKCPECGKRVKRLIGGGTGIIFKGSGFYVTDSRKNGGSSGGSGSSAAASGDSSTKSSDKKSETGSSTGSDSSSASSATPTPKKKPTSTDS